MSSTLTIETDNAGNKYLLDHPITIVRPLAGSLSDYQVICARFRPFGTTNRVLFNDKWVVYASALPTITNKEVIPLSVTHSADLGKVYVFNGSAIASSGTCPNTEYGLKNKKTDNNNLVCGLGESIQINGNDAADTANSVASLPINNTIYFTPSNIILVLTSTGLQKNMIISSLYLKPNSVLSSTSTVISEYLSVNISNSETIYFDNTTKLFKMGSLPSDSEKIFPKKKGLF